MRSFNWKVTERRLSLTEYSAGCSKFRGTVYDFNCKGQSYRS